MHVQHILCYKFNFHKIYFIILFKSYFNVRRKKNLFVKDFFQRILTFVFVFTIPGKWWYNSVTYWANVKVVLWNPLVKVQVQHAGIVLAANHQGLLKSPEVLRLQVLAPLRKIPLLGVIQQIQRLAVDGHVLLSGA